jgi:hypothetical protein
MDSGGGGGGGGDGAARNWGQQQAAVEPRGGLRPSLAQNNERQLYTAATQGNRRSLRGDEEAYGMM